MDPQNYIYGFVTGSSGVAVVVMIFAWLRYRKRDSAIAKKAESEAFETETHAMSEGWRDLVSALNKIRHTEQIAFERIVSEERVRITALEEKVARYQIRLDEMIALEEQCQKNVYRLSVENKRISEELLFLQKMKPDLPNQ